MLSKRPPIRIRQATARQARRWLQQKAVLPTRLDLLRDLNSQLQRRRRLRTGNTRLASGACAFDERRELKLERFAVFDLDSVTPNLFSDAPIDLAALILIIEREIRVFLKNANLAHSLGTDAAGRHIRDATVFKVEPRVCNVFAVAENGHANRVN